ncbi:hypothetical protein C8R45DRAFT_1037823 [Mycena sanguinolenta]|nr:hypothetical protein C8R45DRAFT_1037823 [Mycena sanguinolenta]
MPSLFSRARTASTPRMVGHMTTSWNRHPGHVRRPAGTRPPTSRISADGANGSMLDPAFLETSWGAVLAASCERGWGLSDYSYSLTALAQIMYFLRLRLRLGLICRSCGGGNQKSSSSADSVVNFMLHVIEGLGAAIVHAVGGAVSRKKVLECTRVVGGQR